MRTSAPAPTQTHRSQPYDIANPDKVIKVRFEANQGLGTGQAGLIEGAVIAADLHKPGGLGLLGALDDGPRPGFLGGQGLLVAAGSFGGVRPDCSPGARVGFGVPDRFGAFAAVVDGPVRVPRCDPTFITLVRTYAVDRVQGCGEVFG